MWSWTGSKKKLPSSTAERRQWITPGDERLSIRQQCQLLDLPRSTYYHAGVGESDENLQLMRLIDEQYLHTPFYGSRGMTQWLIRQGHDVNRKRVRRLMRVMGLEAIYPRRRTSVPCPEHRIFPYLLRKLVIERPDQVWSADITYVPLRRGFMYLVAVLDWHSRYVLSWELSNTLDSGYCGRRWKPLWLGSSPRYSTPIKGRSSPVGRSQACWRRRTWRSAWMVAAEPSTTCSSNGCGGA